MAAGSASDLSNGLSIGAKAGLGVGGTLSGIALIVIIVALLLNPPL